MKITAAGWFWLVYLAGMGYVAAELLKLALA
jgi:hypothetical protein